MSLNKRKYQIKLVGKLPETFECPLCNALLEDPIQTFCGYRACANCYENKISSDKQCPFNCGESEEATGQHHFRDRFVVRDIYALRCYCHFQDNGCKWEGEIGDLEVNHLAICNYYYVTCNMCRENVLELELRDHQLNQCPQRMETCNKCQQQYRACRKKDHDLQCDKIPKRCPFNCETLVLRKDLFHHVKACPKVLSKSVCPYELVGCDHQFEDVMVHMQEDYNFHAALMIAQIDSLNEKIDGLNKQIHEQNEKFNKLVESKLPNYEIEKENRKVTILQSLIKESKESYNSSSEEIKRRISEIEKAIISFSQQISDNNIVNKIRNTENVLKEIYEQYQQMENELYASEYEEKPDEEMPKISSKNNSDLKKYAKIIEQYESNYAILNASLSDIELKLNYLSSTTYNGKILWRIENVMYRTAEAKQGRHTTLHSPPSFTERFGYKFCVRLYLNGDGDGKNTHVSIFFVIMRSEYDHLLEWPFSKKVTFRLIHPMDDSFSIRESFQPDRSSVSFQKPKREMNIAAGCPQFIAKDELHVRNFLIDDSIFIETIVGDGVTIKN